VKEGWEPLCQFLGVPVPDLPFPNVNDTPTMLDRISKIKRAVVGTWAVTAGLASLVGYYLDFNDGHFFKTMGW